MNIYCNIVHCLGFICFVWIMSVLIYNGEKFKRTKIWYLVFGVVFASVFVLSLLNNNIVWAILMFFLLWGYFYYSTINNQIVTMTIQKNQIIVWSKSYVWNTFSWYVVEVYSENQKIKNIVFITAKWHIIYTFDDSQENIRSFLWELDGYLPMLGDFHQTSLEKFSRKIKL